jgi:hypothetical protein
MTVGPTPEQLARLPPKLRAKLESKGVIGDKAAAKPGAGAAHAGTVFSTGGAATAAVSNAKYTRGPEVGAAGPEVTPDAAVEGWVRVKNGDSEYWWNPDSGATSWNSPGEGADGEPQAKTFSDTYECGSQFAGKLIGKKGVVLQEIQDSTGCKVQIPKDADKNPRMTVTVSGPKKGAVQKCLAVLKMMVGLSRTVEQAIMEIDGKAIDWASVRAAKQDKEKWQELNLSPEDAYAIQWLRDFHKPDPPRPQPPSTPSSAPAKAPKRPISSMDPMNPANYIEVDDGKGNDGGSQTIKKRKKNELIETMD